MHGGASAQKGLLEILRSNAQLYEKLRELNLGK
jgi:hypothetical protein